MAMTVRPDEKEQKDVDKLKEIFDTKSGSKALLKAAKNYPVLKDDLERSQAENRELNRQLAEIKRSISNYAQAQATMLQLAE